MVKIGYKKDGFDEYIDAWIEFNNYLYIQMELCDTNLKNIIDLKDNIFNENTNSELEIALNHYISSELFRELIENN